MIIASLQALRRHGYSSRYAEIVHPAARDELLGLASPAWVPFALAEAHYAACDALGIPLDEMLAIGNEVSRVDAAGAHVLLGLARAGGITVWSLLERLPTNWNRMYRGGAFDVAKVGPKEARVVVSGNALARYEYWRVGLRGVGEGLLRHFCNLVFIKELPNRRRLDSASFVIAWA